ncbi:membrane protein [Xenorhabdus szentirmaii]|nr:membrane protein [Xenorhabdus szentirmaii]
MIMSENQLIEFNKKPQNTIRQFIPGFILASALTVLSIYISNIPWFIGMGLSALTWAILLGIIIGDTLYPFLKSTCNSGIHFSKHYLLRAGIIFYGFRLTFQNITEVGLTGVLIDLIMLSSTFLLALWIGGAFFRLDNQTVILIGAGSSICGAAAVMATETVIKAPANKVAVAVSTVVIFGTLAIFIYPWFYQLNAHYQWFSFSQAAFGIFSGSTVHEVAQVVAIGHTLGNEAESTAIISKMIRVMMLAPFLLLLSGYTSRKEAQFNNQQQEKSRITIPWFAVFFIVVTAVNSFHLLPASLVEHINTIDTIMLTMAMAALGLTTHVSAIRQAGIKPLLLALILFIWLMGGGLFINQMIQYWLG